MTSTFEFVVVAGGIFGTGLAWEIARSGASVALLEADTVASGASGGPGRRGVRANSRGERELPLSRLAHQIWPGLAQEIGGATGYERIGGLELFDSEAMRERAEAQVLVQQRYGIESRLIKRDELRGMEPDISSSVVGAVYCPGDGVVDHTATTTGLARAARQAGASIFEHTPAQELERRGSRVTAVVTARERFVATRDVALLANYGVADLLRALGIELPIARVFPQVLLVPPVEALHVRHLVGHLERRVIVKQLPSREIMISGGWLGRWNNETGRGEAVPELVAANFGEACVLFPALSNATVREAFADRAEAAGPDLLPVIDRVDGFDNLTVGTGWSGHGFAIAPAVSRLLASWLLDRSKPAELDPFIWGRWHAG